MIIQLLCDNPSSWIIPYIKDIQKELQDMGYNSKLFFSHQEIEEGDILVLLSCERIFKQLHLNKYNLVVHESDLPEGKGWSPLTWQVLEGKKKIPVTLIEASEKIDSGVIYDQLFIELDGSELINEIRQKQAEATQQLIINFLNSYPHNNGEPQRGNESFYPRRKPESSKLDVNRTIAEQFNLLRVCDNDRYPAFFELNGVKYIIKIEKIF